MSNDKLVIFDTTLRDGEQSPGASMTKDEKVRIARALERMRVDVIEAGFPVASQGDGRLCCKPMRCRFELNRELLLNVTGSHHLERQGAADDRDQGQDKSGHADKYIIKVHRSANSVSRTSSAKFNEDF